MRDPALGNNIPSCLVYCIILNIPGCLANYVVVEQGTAKVYFNALIVSSYFIEYRNLGPYKYADVLSLMQQTVETATV